MTPHVALDRLRPLLNDAIQWKELLRHTDDQGLYRTVMIGGVIEGELSPLLSPWKLWCTTQTHVDTDDMGVGWFTTIRLRRQTPSSTPPMGFFE